MVIMFARPTCTLAIYNALHELLPRVCCTNITVLALIFKFSCSSGNVLAWHSLHENCAISYRSDFHIGCDKYFVWRRRCCIWHLDDGDPPRKLVSTVIASDNFFLSRVFDAEADGFLSVGQIKQTILFTGHKWWTFDFATFHRIIDT